MSETSPPDVLVLESPTSNRPVDSNRLRWFELFLVLTVAFSSAFFRSVYILKHGPSAYPLTGNLHWIYGIAREVLGLALLAYVLLRRGLRFQDLGLRWSWREFRKGFALWFVFAVSQAVAHFALKRGFLLLTGAIPAENHVRDVFGHPSVMALPFCFVNPVFEELIVRAFLMTEILELTGSAVLAVVASTILQASYHLYYGWLGALSLSIGFLVFSVYYLRTRRATPIVVAHGIMDLLATTLLMLR